MAVEKIEERREKIKEIQELNGQSEDANETDDLVSISELPLEMVLEMAKDPNAEETILEMAVEKIKEIQVLNGQSEDADESDLVSISELPLEMVLEMAKHPKADGHILEMAVEKIKGVQELNGQGEDEPYVYASEPSSIDVPESLAGALPMEILLEMAKDPEAKEQILEMAMQRLKELQELNLETEEELVALEPIAVDMSELPIEIILEMAKDTKAEGHILEMAMEKIKEVQDQSEAKPEETKPTSIQVPDSLAGALPMEILLEMAKDPEAKELILELAVKRLNELQQLNAETEEELVVLEPVAIDGTSVADDDENFDKMIVVEFPRFR